MPLFQTIQKVIKHPYVLCLLAGALSSLAMAPANAWYLLLLGLSIFYIKLAGAAPSWKTFFYGYAFGFGYFVFGLSWIGNALLVDGNEYAWAWPLAVCGLPAALSVFYGLTSYLTVRLGNLRRISGLITFSAVFAGMEWLRGHVFTGFPWNLFGYAWADILPIIQIVSVGDIYWLTWLSILWLSLFGFLFVGSQGLTQKLIITALVLLSFGASFFWGANRLSNAPHQSMESDQYVKIVQPNIPQHEKWKRSKLTENFFKLVRLSYVLPDDPEGNYTIIWPETATTDRFLNDPTSRNLITQALGAYSQEADLITGVILRNSETGTYKNAVQMISKRGKTENSYTKHHLVPFGEYIPFQSLIPISTITKFSGFEKGSGPASFTTSANISYSPLVCYEGIFPNNVINRAQNKPDLLINVTNDAWYGRSAGPYQHFTHARFRAVEEGIPLTRVANTGLSGMIDAYGRIVFQSELQTVVSKTLPLPPKIGEHHKNAYTIYIGFWIFVFAVVGIQLLRKHKKED